jgi:hypothetical protein
MYIYPLSDARSLIRVGRRIGECYLNTNHLFALRSQSRMV